MVIHTCINYNKNFNKKSNFINHIENKKKPCIITNIINTEKNSVKCNIKDNSYYIIDKWNRGIIYLIQPSELVGTNRYKIGMSNNPDLERCKNGYKKGSRYLSIMECNDPLILEGNIKKH